MRNTGRQNHVHEWKEEGRKISSFSLCAARKLKVPRGTRTHARTHGHILAGESERVWERFFYSDRSFGEKRADESFFFSFRGWKCYIDSPVHTHMKGRKTHTAHLGRRERKYVVVLKQARAFKSFHEGRGNEWTNLRRRNPILLSAVSLNLALLTLRGFLFLFLPFHSLLFSVFCYLRGPGSQSVWFFGLMATVNFRYLRRGTTHKKEKAISFQRVFFLSALTCHTSGPTGKPTNLSLPHW